MPKTWFSHSSVCGLSRNWAMIAIPIGSIITLVAVFEIHIDSAAVATMKPRMMLVTLVPMSRMMFNAMRLCSPHFSIAIAIRNPPM